MEKNSVVIATMTWARDKTEEKLLRCSLPLLAQTGLPVFITDGGSDQRFLDFLAGFPTFHVYQAVAKGVWAQVKNSLQKAHEADSTAIFYTEPDKLLFFKDALPKLLAEFKLKHEPGIFMASRSDHAFSTFPAFQQMTETTINHCCAEITGLKNDYTYGPFFMNRSLVPHLEFIKEDIGWGWRPFVFCIAHRLGLPVDSYNGEYICPADQQQDAPKERIYRMRQLQQNIQGVVLASTFPIQK